MFRVHHPLVLLIPIPMPLRWLRVRVSPARRCTRHSLVYFTNLPLCLLSFTAMLLRHPAPLILILLLRHLSSRSKICLLVNARAGLLDYTWSTCWGLTCNGCGLEFYAGVLDVV
ncbi:hypothetical protein BDQ12DRAFT_689964 [Crucibulum laeve]|uniref:Uncharacterized protein n=1 Tax=Crucibulum laeve TaxID=68775 RepID=A0A5C3LPM8_9AGAR|nr:hypothetical protein BDQ12DRAFT_689964 [Crucibulum laeve]